MKKEAKNSWRILFEQENKMKPGSDSWRRYEAFLATTTTAALANGCTMADLTWFIYRTSWSI
jgi:hypothetical protein